MQIEAVKSQQLPQMPLLLQLQLQLRQFVLLANLLLHTFMGTAPKVLMSQLSLAIFADLHTCNRERERQLERC